MSIKDLLNITKKFWYLILIAGIAGLTAGILSVPQAGSSSYIVRQSLIFELLPGGGNEFSAIDSQALMSRLSIQERFKFFNEGEFIDSAEFTSKQLNIENPTELIDINFDINLQQFEFVSTSANQQDALELLDAATMFVSNELATIMKDQTGELVQKISSVPTVEVTSGKSSSFRWIASFLAAGLISGIVLSIIFDLFAKTYSRVGTLKSSRLGKIIGPVIPLSTVQGLKSRNWGSYLSIQNAAELICLEAEDIPKTKMLILYEDTRQAFELSKILNSHANNGVNQISSIILTEIKDDFFESVPNTQVILGCSPSSLNVDTKSSPLKTDHKLYVFLPLNSVSTALYEWLHLCGKVVLIVQGNKTLKSSVNNLINFMDQSGRQIDQTHFFLD